jgi:hypothetical protein
MATGWTKERIERETRTEMEFQTHLRLLGQRLDPQAQEIILAVERCRCSYGQFLAAGRGGD